MPALLELQRALRAQLLGDAARADAGGGDALLAGDDGALRLAIYRNTALAHWSTHCGCRIPAVQRLVGADFFEGAAREFIRSHRAARAPT